MTGYFWFDWPLLALSLTNGIVLLWLGLVVLLNTERRTAGVALLVAAAWLGSAFFAAHTAILASGEGPASESLNLWWEIGWLPLLALPLTWYGIVLWYGGFGIDVALRRRHGAALALLILLCGALIIAFSATASFPSFLDAVNLRFGGAVSFWGVPWFLVLYPLYMLAALALSFDVLLRPPSAPTRYSASALSRARPWLLAANTLLLAVGTLVTAIMLWVARTPGPTATNELFRDALPLLAVWTADADAARRLALAITWTDLLVSALLSGVIFCISYALVQYEVFSGRVLPRHALRRHWREAWLLGIGYGITVGAALAAGWRPVYSLLLTALLMTIFFALLGWRTLATQTGFVRRLQPFVVSTHLAEELIAPAATAHDNAAFGDAHTTFTALCVDVLQTEYAALVAIGPLAMLVPRPLVHPVNAAAPPTLPDLVGLQQAAVAIDVDQPELPLVMWALPLHGTQGLIGVLLLGKRVGNGLYTEEEIAIARATGERLLDLLAAAALARRLLDLSREQWQEGQVADRQTRRVLHDDVLPDLHAALILLGKEGGPAIAEARALLAITHRRTADLLRALPVRPPARPSGQLLEDLRRLVEDEMAAQFDTVQFIVDAEATRAASRLRTLHAEVIFYAARELVRNAARHGQGSTAPLALAVTVSGGEGLMITVRDNGTSKLAPDGAGASQGLALHAAMLAVVGGTLSVTTLAGGGFCATIRGSVQDDLAGRRQSATPGDGVGRSPSPGAQSSMA